MDTDYGALERCVPAGEVIDILSREHDRRGYYANFEVCQRVAMATILARLRDGKLEAWSTTCRIDSTIDTGPRSVEQIISTWDFHSHDGGPAKVPVEFWMHFHHAGEDFRTFDPIASDFRFEYMDSDFSSRDGGAYGVYFDQRGLPPASVPSLLGSMNFAVSEAKLPATATMASSKGRPVASWWPAFAAELAMHCLMSDLPDGVGTEGQSEVLDAVFAKMAERGKPEPSRTQVQPVVNEVLTRFRSAGK